MSQPFKLFRLQQIDSLIDRAQARLKEIEATLKENEAVLRAEQRAQETDDILQTMRKALRRAEENVQDQRVKIEQTEATLYSGKVRNPKELQDMQNEAAALKRFRAVLEDRQLDAMIEVEEAEAVHAAAVHELEQVRSQFAQKHADLANEQAGLLKDVARMEGERQATVGSIPAEELILYNQLRQQRRGIAVAKVTDKACSACGTTLNAALLHAARSASQLTRCSTCGRILYGL